MTINGGESLGAVGDTDAPDSGGISRADVGEADTAREELASGALGQRADARSVDGATRAASSVAIETVLLVTFRALELRARAILGSESSFGASGDVVALAVDESGAGGAVGHADALVGEGALFASDVEALTLGEDLGRRTAGSDAFSVHESVVLGTADGLADSVGENLAVSTQGDVSLVNDDETRKFLGNALSSDEVKSSGIASGSGADTLDELESLGAANSGADTVDLSV